MVLSGEFHEQRSEKTRGIGGRLWGGAEHRQHNIVIPDSRVTATRASADRNRRVFRERCGFVERRPFVRATEDPSHASGCVRGDRRGGSGGGGVARRLLPQPHRSLVTEGILTRKSVLMGGQPLERIMFCLNLCIVQTVFTVALEHSGYFKLPMECAAQTQ